jgi:hypothetical protein
LTNTKPRKQPFTKTEMPTGETETNSTNIIIHLSIENLSKKQTPTIIAKKNKGKKIGSLLRGDRGGRAGELGIDSDAPLMPRCGTEAYAPRV